MKKQKPKERQQLKKRKEHKATDQRKGRPESWSTQEGAGMEQVQHKGNLGKMN